MVYSRYFTSNSMYFTSNSMYFTSNSMYRKSQFGREDELLGVVMFHFINNQEIVL